MISFVTLLLGIVVGVIDVTVAVGAEVAAVELRVDGETVERRQEGPWIFSVDFGERPSPLELTAVAFDSEGREIGEARQWVNMPRGAAELDVSLSDPRDGARISAAVSWASTRDRKPPAVRAALDGSPLEVDDPTRILLPPVDLDLVHFLRVEAEFEHGPVSRELVFGGEYVERAHAELSSVAIALDESREVTRYDVIITADGNEVPVVAVETGPIDLVVVVDPRSLATMPGLTGSAGATRDRRLAHAAFRADKALTPRHPELNLRLLWPIADQPGAMHDYRLFPSTPPEPPSGAGGLLWFLASAGFPGSGDDARIAEAVAVAGVMASERGNRRAVILLLGGSQADGPYGGEGVRAYLRELGVPLYVWSSRRVSDEDRRQWGEITMLDGTRDLAGAWQKLQDDLNRQRVVWLEGLHLPKSLDVSTATVMVAGR